MVLYYATCHVCMVTLAYFCDEKTHATLARHTATTTTTTTTTIGVIGAIDEEYLRAPRGDS